MSLVGGFRFSGITDTTTSDRIINFSGYKPSGNSDGNLLPVALYTYDYTDSKWIPYSGGRHW